MYRGRRIGVVVPAFSEERLIGRTIASIPAFVDVIVVVDDASADGTVHAARCSGDPRLHVVCHPENRGAGAAIATGYRSALALGAEIMAVMAADAQMDAADLPRLLDPIAEGEADYVKGNRFVHRERRRMPRARRWAGRALSYATRAVTGLSVDDTQCGYTALSGATAANLPLDSLWPRYGYPNDLLALLALDGRTVAEAPVRPVYADENSGVRPWHFAVVLWVILRRSPALRPWARRRVGERQRTAVPLAR